MAGLVSSNHSSVSSGSAAFGGSSPSSSNNDETSKIIGLSLAIGSGLLIGASFVFKKKGLINCTRHGMLAGEGYAYLKSFMWWTGMLMMVVGEVCNFVAYAFVQPILVTPLGALSVVICAILSSIFLKERLNLQGKVGCAQCIIGATIIVLHAPEQTSVKTIQEFKSYMLQPGFLVWMAVLIIVSLILIFKAGPRWGREHMMVYITVCSLIGSLSVVATQGLGAAIVHNISTGEPQFTNWFIYLVIVFMVITLLTEINYLNKALNLFNTAMVTPTYYVTFTSATIITSAILYQGFNASVVAILTVCAGFLVICGGVLLLQTSKPVVHLHAPGASSSGISIIGTIDGGSGFIAGGDADDASIITAATASGRVTIEDLEPTAADMRASPFSSIRRIARDLRQQPSLGSAHYRGASGAAGAGTGSYYNSSHSPLYSSPLNPNRGAGAESLLNRKRRLSNAASVTGVASSASSGAGVMAYRPLQSRPQSIVGAHHLLVPGTTSGLPHSTMIMGPNDAQVRVQLCEIVVSDEKHGTTNRYQIYRPLPPRQQLSGDDKKALSKQQQAPLSSSRSSTIRFEQSPVNQASLQGLEEKPSEKDSSKDSNGVEVVVDMPEDPEAKNEATEQLGEKQTRPVSQYGQQHRPISGSMFMPPRLSISPATPPVSSGSSSTLTSTNEAQSPTATSPTSLSPTSPIVAGSFFMRPRFNRAPTSPTVSVSGAGGDIMEMNDPTHIGGRTVIAVEPVQAQPTYSLYIPPVLPMSSRTAGAPPSPRLNAKSSSASGLSQGGGTGGGEFTEKETNPSAGAVTDGKGSESTEQVRSGVDPADGLSSQPPSKPKRGFFGTLFHGRGRRDSDTPLPAHRKQEQEDQEKDEVSNEEEKRDEKDTIVPAAELSPTSSSSSNLSGADQTSTTNLVAPTGDQSHRIALNPVQAAAAAVFQRSKHPTRISEGEEEEDSEDA